MTDDVKLDGSDEDPRGRRILDGTDLEISSVLGELWGQRSDRYSELRGALGTAASGDERRIEMHYIGG